MTFSGQLSRTLRADGLLFQNRDRRGHPRSQRQVLALRAERLESHRTSRRGPCGFGSGLSEWRVSSSHFGNAAMVSPVVMVREVAPSMSLGVSDQQRRGWRAFAHHDGRRHHRCVAKMRTADEPLRRATPTSHSDKPLGQATRTSRSRSRTNRGAMSDDFSGAPRAAPKPVSAISGGLFCLCVEKAVHPRGASETIGH